MLAPYSSATGELELSVTQYRESLRLFGELGAQEDESLIRLRLAEVLSRQGKADEARAEVDIAVRRTESRRDVEAHFGSNAESIFGQILMADIERMSGDLDRARELRDEALVRLSRIPEPHPIRGHVHAITFALAAKIDVADADVIAAHLRLQTAYRVGVATKDLPIAAAVGVAVAMLAEQIDALSDALEILGAAARLRGTEDGTQFDIARLRSLADERLGTPTASAIYDRGRRLDKDQAIARLDPGLLRLPLPTP
jgi:tetratricopeptide (TPR) repeat protein